MQIKFGEGWLVTGTATKDAEYKEVGDKETPLASFSLAIGKRQDSTTIFANCKAWRKLGKYAATIKKGDAVMAVGTIETHEYNGQNYTTLICEWLNRAGEIEPPIYIPSTFKAVDAKAVNQINAVEPKLEEVKTIDELPF